MCGIYEYEIVSCVTMSLHLVQKRVGPYRVGRKRPCKCVRHIETFAPLGCLALVKRWIACIWLRGRDIDDHEKEEQKADGEVKSTKDHDLFV